MHPLSFTGYVDNTPAAMALLPDGDIVVGGGGADSDWTQCAALVARLGSTGTVADTAADDLGNYGWGYDLAMTAQDGKIVLVGDDGYDVAIAMFDASTLELDSSFGDDGIVIDSFFANYSDEAFNVSIRQDGKVVLTATNGSMVYVARYTAAGADDTTFNNGSDNLPLNVGWGLPHHWSAAFVIASGKHMRPVGWGLPHQIPQPPRSGLIVPPDQRYFAQHDANFNITSITDANGQVAERYLYTAYGEVEYRGGSWETLQGSTTQLGWTYLFQGRPLDGSSGKYDFRNRPYDAPTGRFTSADPLGYPDGANRYQAFGSNPVNRLDPTGLLLVKLDSEIWNEARQEAFERTGIHVQYQRNLWNTRVKKGAYSSETLGKLIAEIYVDKKAWYYENVPDFHIFSTEEYRQSFLDGRRVSEELARRDEELARTGVMTAASGSAYGNLTAAEHARLMKLKDELSKTGMLDEFNPSGPWADHRYLTKKQAGTSSILDDVVYGGAQLAMAFGGARSSSCGNRSMGMSRGRYSGARSANRVGSSSAAEYELFKARLAAQELSGAPLGGSALKTDPMHLAPRFVKDMAGWGQHFTIRGADGVQRNLVQVLGEVNGQPGVFEWIVDNTGVLTHQRFIPGGGISGFPNQPVPLFRPDGTAVKGPG